MSDQTLTPPTEDEYVPRTIALDDLDVDFDAAIDASMVTVEDGLIVEGKVVKVGKTKKTAKCYHPECNEKRKKETAGAKPSMGTKPGKGGGKKGVKKKGGKTTFAGAQQTMGGMGDMFAGLE